jgi:glutaminyl-tRNA synthetase
MENNNANNANRKNQRSDFIREIIKKDLEENTYRGKVHTRFPPEPNGYLHIGHAKAVCLNFGIAEEYAGKCNLRFDDTNPSKEETEYEKAIKEDINWLGFDWEDRLFYASDYFEQMYRYAVSLIKKEKAYVCDLTAENIREYRGTLTSPGKESPYRNRSVEENLVLFERMRAGEFEQGEKVLRAKIDMASPNLNMRDPVMYRIIKESHYRQGNKWVIYPTYDWAHCLEDSIEGITHSLCSLEFENHRPLYDWFLAQLDIHHPRQLEFARLNLTYTVMSKRLLLFLIKEKLVKGWDDPRLPTIRAMRRKGYPPEAIRNFCRRIGIAKTESVIDKEFLEHCVREILNKKALRFMAVLNPLKVVIDNYPAGTSEELEAVNNPEDSSAGTRKVPFSKVLYIEREDFMENPPKKFYRLAPGREVRLRYAYFIKCTDVIKDTGTGEVKELHCTYDPQTKGGDAADGRKVKATLHWVSAAHSIPGEVRIYNNLFNKKDPGSLKTDEEIKSNINDKSLEVLENCRLEPGLKNVTAGKIYQFERKGYFCVDPDYSKEKLVFNRTVTLKDEWAKLQKTRSNTHSKT